MNKYFAGYAGAAVVMLALDMLWLGVIARTTYRHGIGHLMAGQPNLAAAAAFYVLYTAGLVFFVLAPTAGQPGWGSTLLRGALFGLVAYATYDLSNLATLRGWPLGLTLIDLAWGSALSATAAAAGRLAMNWAAPG